MVLLDGIEVENKKVNPAKHKFIGMFRKPDFGESDWEPYCRVCGINLMSEVGISTFNCWQRGHFDLPQYITIKKN